MTVLRSGERESISLPAGFALTVVASATGSGRVQRLGDKAGQQSQGFTGLVAGETKSVGPYAVQTRHEVIAHEGTLTTEVARVDFPTASEAVSGFGTVGGDLKELVGAGAPEGSVQASLDVNPTGDDNGLTFTAVRAGEGGNAIAVEYLDPGANDAALSVEVANKVISVNLGTDSEGEIESTAAEVLAAVEAKAEAAASVSVAIDASDSGEGDDGSGVVTAMARASLANGAGVGAGEAGKGSRYTDTTNGTLYLNTGTKDVPVWTQLAPVD